MLIDTFAQDLACIDLSNWVLVGTTLFLGIVAIFGPAYAERFKQWLASPKLKIEYSHSPPGSHKTKWQVLNKGKYDVYFFRFQILIHGKSIANQCEVLIEELWIYDAAGIAQKVKDFSPINLRYDEKGTTRVDISHNPRPIYWNIGHVSSPEYQEKIELRGNLVDVPSAEGSEELRFALEYFEFPFSQPSLLVPGRYKIKIGVYPDNASPAYAHFDISWTGKWCNDISDMFREIVISHT